MKHIIQYIQEKLKVNSKSKINEYEYKPKSRIELRDLLLKLIKERGNNANLNDVDVSNIKEFSFLFSYGELKEFDGNISHWNVSNAETFEAMFYTSKFSGKNSDLSNWNVSNAFCLACMFERSAFDKKEQIENWNVHEGAELEGIFHACPLEKNPPSWYHE